MFDLFADRLGNITVASGVVRMDFVKISELDKENQKVELSPSFRLVLPIDGMLQTLDALEQIKASLIEQVQLAQHAKQAN